MASTPNFGSTPRCAVALLGTANTNLDGTGTVATVLSAGSSGTRIDRITIKAQEPTTAGMVRLFIHDGTNYRLWREVPVTAVIPSGTMAAFTEEITSTVEALPLLVLPSSYSLRASTHAAEYLVVAVEGSDF